jgi:hypothetical protein
MSYLQVYINKNQDMIEYYEPYLKKCIAIRLSPRFDGNGNYICLKKGRTSGRG